MPRCTLRTRRVAVPLATPLTLAFGRLIERTALFVQLDDGAGHVGHGEVFANWPPGGAAHREVLLHEVFAPLLEAAEWDSPADLQATLLRRTHRLRLQCDEPGPFDQCIAGIDLAAWQLCARREGRSLAERLGVQAASVPIYLSGVAPASAEAVVQQGMAVGVRAFKLMLGADWRAAVPVLARLREQHGEAIELMADANQGLELTESIELVAQLAPLGLRWLEEPLPVDAPHDDWLRLADVARAHGLALAGGENLRGDAAFERALHDGVLSVLQPDLIKWGGLTKLMPLAQEALAAGLRLCPHYLGGPVGWAASALWLGAAGGDGLLETDANGHVLAAAAGLPPPLSRVAGGHLPLATLEPGLPPSPWQGEGRGGG